MESWLPHNSVDSSTQIKLDTTHYASWDLEHRLARRRPYTTYDHLASFKRSPECEVWGRWNWGHTACVVQQHEMMVLRAQSVIKQSKQEEGNRRKRVKWIWGRIGWRYRRRIHEDCTNNATEMAPQDFSLKNAPLVEYDSEHKLGWNYMVSIDQSELEAWRGCALRAVKWSIYWKDS